MQAITRPKEVSLRYHFSASPIKRYRALEVAPLLKVAYGKFLQKKTHTEVVLEALDGYQSYSTLETLLSKGGYIAFKDLDVKSGWEPVGREKASPAPYFLIWNREGQTTENGYPWPWQLAKIRLVKFADRFPNVYPMGKGPNTPEYRGYRIFKSQCFRCHAIDRQGGKIGPGPGGPPAHLAIPHGKVCAPIYRGSRDISLLQDAPPTNTCPRRIWIFSWPISNQKCKRSSMKEKILGIIAGLFLWMYYKTLRYQAHGVSDSEFLSDKILAGWHQDLVINIGYLLGQKITFVISQSKDGSILATAVHLLGFRTIRGSSSRGGIKVLLQAIAEMKKGE